MENKAPSVGMSTNPVGASPDAVVVVPTYNEADNIARLAELIRDVGCSLLVVDDGSPDGTGALVDELAAHDDGISVMHRAHKAGIGPAYSAGFAHVLETSAQIICQMDADFSHDPHDLPRLIDSVKAGADLAIGSRYVVGGDTPDWPVIRRLISRGGNFYAGTLLGVGTRDLTGGFRAWSRVGLAAAEPSTSQASGYAFQVETAWRAVRAGCTVVEHPIIFRDRVAGDSKMGAPIVFEAARLVAKWGFRRITRQLP